VLCQLQKRQYGHRLVLARLACDPRDEAPREPSWETKPGLEHYASARDAVSDTGSIRLAAGALRKPDREFSHLKVRLRTRLSLDVDCAVQGVRIRDIRRARLTPSAASTQEPTQEMCREARLRLTATLGVWAIRQKAVQACRYERLGDNRKKQVVDDELRHTTVQICRLGATLAQSNRFVVSSAGIRLRISLH
jgi:hypothetical protein